MAGKPTYAELNERLSKIEEELDKVRRERDDLRDREGRYGILLDESVDPIFSFTSDGRYDYANRAFADGVGRSLDQIMGKRIWEVFPKEEADRRFAALNQVFQTGEGKVIEVRVPRPDGDRFYITTITPVKDEEGKVSSAICSSKNITERKTMEEALRQSEEKYRLLVESADEGIVIIQAGKLRFLNSRALEFMGYAQDQIIGRDMLDFVHPDDRETLARLYLAKLAGEDVPPGSSWRIQDKSGKTRWLQSRSTLIAWEGHPCLLVLLTDVTEHKNAEDALRESVKTTESIFRAAPVGIGMVIDRMIMQTNDTLCSMTGYSRDEMIGKSARMLYPTQEEYERVGKVKYEEIHVRGTGSIETRWLRKDGKVNDILLSSSPIDLSDLSVGVTFTALDITQRKRAEAALRESEELFRNLFEHHSAVKLIIDPKTGRIIDANTAAAGFYGWSREQLMRMKIQEINTLSPGEIAREMQKAVAEERIHFEFRHRRADGSVREVDVFSSKIEAKGRDLLHSIIHDITDRKRAEEALRESEERYRNILESIEEGYYEVDLAGNFTFFNDSVCRLLGYSREELTGMNDRRYTDARSAKKLFQAFNEVYRTGRPTRGFDWEVIRRDGTRRFVEASVTLMKDAEGRPLGFRGIARDITNRRQAEEDKQRLEAQLQQAQKMEAIGTLAGGIAHDFNNLLMGIQGRASLMLADMNSSDPRFEHLSGIEEYVRSAADLTRQLLGFARGGKYEVKTTDLNELTDRSASLFGRTKKEITIHRKFQPGLRTVEVDRRQIEQVLLNLFVNAWQAMPAGGELYLQTQDVVLDDVHAKPHGVKPGRYVKISVTDTGMGMDEHTKQRLFDPFFTTKGMGRGTGLGLASAYGIIRNHDGFITVYSEKGHGSTFNLYLPAAGKAVTEGAVAPGDLVMGEGTILLVDDEEMILEVGRPLLEKLGYRVLSAGSGKEALALYQENASQIRAVILDMVMPQMSGGETFDRLKAVDPEVKVLLASGYSLNGQAQEILNRGCEGFIQKPFNLRELSQRLGEILGRP